MQWSGVVCNVSLVMFIPIPGSVRLLKIVAQPACEAWVECFDIEQMMGAQVVSRYGVFHGCRGQAQHAGVSSRLEVGLLGCEFALSKDDTKSKK